MNVTHTLAIPALGVALLAGALPAAAQAPEPDPHPERLTSVANPRTTSGSWVADPAKHLRAETVDTLDAEIGRLSESTGVEIAVVVLDSLEGLSASDAALTLHRRWGVGQRAHDNGLVLLWSPAEREVSVSVGYGLEGIIPDARAGRIIDRSVLPGFREGDYDAGILGGVRALAAAAREDPASRTRPGGPDEGSRGRTIAAILAGVTSLGGATGAAAWLLYRRRRRRPRPCPAGHGLMQRVSDDADEPYLADGERTEERIGSIDYDVWRCDVCAHHEAVPWPAFFTRYSKCERCGRRAVQEKETVLTPATRQATGLLRVTTSCEHCGATSSRTRVIPVVTSSSGGGSGSGSSGGSFGGGSAGGGGASRSY